MYGIYKKQEENMFQVAVKLEKKKYHEALIRNKTN